MCFTERITTADMTYNDMEVIMYKILKYLYECMKAGVRPREEDFCAGSKLIGDIPGSYWDQVMLDLQENRLVQGVMKRMTKDGILVSVSDSISITFQGRMFLKDNSGMRDARDFLGRAFEVVLESIIRAITL